MNCKKIGRIERIIIGILIVCGSAAASLAAGADVIREWNAEAVRMIVPTGPPVHQTRLMAIYQLAVHDAVNGISGKYKTYLSPGPAPDGASPEAAAIAASYRSLCGLLPQAQCDEALEIYLDSLAAYGISPDDPGINYGISAADAMLAARANDGAGQAQFMFDPLGTFPGLWHPLPTQVALRPGWGAVKPFVLRSASQFRPDPPPALDSEVYLRDLEELRVIGRKGNDCPPMTERADCRTVDQNEIALFWRDGSPVTVWNQPMYDLSKDMDISTAARSFALLNVTGADSGIACWEAKYGIEGISGGYNFWRPQAAINFADGNTAWLPTHNTPPHPEYPSGHTTNSTAMASILAFIFGDYPGPEISAKVGLVTRTWDSFSEAADEVIDARVYSGIHFRNTDEVGSKLGAQVARFVWTHSLTECKGKGTCK